MTTLIEIVPDVDVLLALAPEELAPILLRLAKERVQNCMCMEPETHGYTQNKQREIEIASSEAWNWLRVHSLIVPASGMNGKNGWMMISRRGANIVDNGDFQRFREAAAFPKALLHPSIADRVWLAMARGDLDIAVFAAFKAVEEAVRNAGGFDLTDIGVPLMRKAFDKSTGSLTDKTQPEAEREALAHLFAGAIGSYKNPHSHRTVTITDSKEAQEMVMLASHLLRIVDVLPPYNWSRFNLVVWG